MIFLPTLERPRLRYDLYSRWRRMAVSLGLSARAKARLEWFIWHDTHGSDAALACRHFAIPKKTWYKWAKRFDPMNLRLLEDRPKAPINRRRREITFLQKD